MAETLTQKIGTFVSGLAYEDLPAAVVDKAKACVLHMLCIAVDSYEHSPLARQAVGVAKALEGSPGGSTVWAEGAKLAPTGAALANTVMASARYHEDAFRGASHIGLMAVPSALALAEPRRLDGKTFLAAVVAAYETQTALVDGFIPVSSRRGFRSSPIYGVLGSAAGCSRVLGLGAAETAHALGFAASFASGLVEPMLAGTNEIPYHSAHAARDAILAAVLAEQGAVAAPAALEGPAGFYRALVGVGEAEVAGLADHLGERWNLLEVALKRRPLPMHHQAIVEMVLRRVRALDVAAEDVAELRIEMSEEDYTFPGFPRYPAPGAINTNTYEYVAAATLLHGASPLPPDFAERNRAAVADLMARTRAGGSAAVPQGEYRLALRLRNGRTVADTLDTGFFRFGFEEDARVMRALAADTPAVAARVEALIAGVAEIEGLADVGDLARRTVTG
jgi:2-methylcitrate dehydratase PrpD